MNRQNFINTFKLSDNLIVYEHVDTITAVQFDALVLNG